MCLSRNPIIQVCVSFTIFMLHSIKIFKYKRFFLQFTLKCNQEGESTRTNPADCVSLDRYTTAYLSVAALSLTHFSINVNYKFPELMMWQEVVGILVTNQIY